VGFKNLRSDRVSLSSTDADADADAEHGTIDG